MIDLDELGERLLVERVASQVYSHMREIVQAHQDRALPEEPFDDVSVLGED